MAYIIGIFATGAAIWAMLHTGEEQPGSAKRDWTIAGIIIIALGAIAGSSHL